MDRKDEIFQFICEFRNVKGYAPSLREIVAGTSVASTWTVHRYLVEGTENGRTVSGVPEVCQLQLDL